MYFIDKTNKAYTRSNNRVSDYKELMKEAKFNPDPAARKLAVEAMSDIKKESYEIRSMRESLIRAHRRSEPEEVKDIHEYIKNKGKYKNG